MASRAVNTGGVDGPCACVGRKKRSRRRRRWLEVSTVGRALFVMSVAFFVVGILVTVFGFGGGDDWADVETRSRQLPLQVYVGLLRVE